jgi:prepilin-type N-terminal cleavage/methylation domain-containing protein
MPRFRRDSSYGVTLVELLVVLAIVGVLAGLAMMGVQYARESARRAGCASNLRNLALAVASFEDARRALPYGNDEKAYSVHFSILPHLEEGARYDQFDREEYAFNEPNRSRGSTSPLVFQCSQSVRRGEQFTSYLGNAGTGHFDGANGVFPPFVSDPSSGGTPGIRSPISFAAVTDGLTHTAMFSETRGVFRDEIGSLRHLPRTSLTSSNYAFFVESCRRISPDAPRGRTLGDGWINGNLSYTRYYHILRPNQPSCVNGPVSKGIYTASSLHPGGAMTAFCDQSTRFVTSSIASGVWRSMGSRNGDDFTVEY